MLLKRKRSESELSYSSSSTGSALNSPPRPGPSSFASTHHDAESTSPMRWQMATASHLPSRTMKRFRNGRPSEDEVHRHPRTALGARAAPYTAGVTAQFLEASKFTKPIRSSAFCRLASRRHVDIRA
ncbi:orf21 protein [Seiridium cupressi]